MLVKFLLPEVREQGLMETIVGCRGYPRGNWMKVEEDQSSCLFLLFTWYKSVFSILFTMKPLESW